MSQYETDILLNTFYIKRKRYRALFNLNEIIWEKETNSKGNDKTTIPISDVIVVESSESHQTKTNEQMISDESHIETTSNAIGSVAASSKKLNKYLKIHYAKRIVKSLDDCNRWRNLSVVLHNCDSNIIVRWYNSLQNALKVQNRIRKVLVFINPFGGQKRGHRIYEKCCKPLFLLANIDANCIISQRANQINEILMTNKLEQYDAICCVGGDGTFAEVVNGLLFRTIKDMGFDILKPKFIPKPKIPVAVIPAGSTDTVAYSLHGTHDVTTAAIHMVLGQKRGLDICSIENTNGLIRFCASVMSYGYLGDVALQSEKYRWMGTKRYEYTGIRKFLTNNTYPAEISVLLPDLNAKRSLPSINNIDQLHSSYQQNTDDEKCFVNCRRCRSSGASILPIREDNYSSMSEQDPRFPYERAIHIAKKNCDSNLSHSKRQNSFEDRNFELASPANFLAWKKIKGNFFMISGANITCACSRSPNGISKYCHLGDGSIDLILVHKATFLSNIRLLLKMTHRNADIRDLPFVEVYRTKKFCFRAYSEDRSWDGSCSPITNEASSKISQWNCDGEIIHDLEIVMSCHCQLLDVFMRGPYPYQEEMSHSTCCSGLCTS